MSTTTAAPPQTTRPELSLVRINLMRAGYAFMGIGLALVKWPLLPEAHTLPLYEGVTLALLTAPGCMEIHVSGNDGRSDAHQKLAQAPWWLEVLQEAKPSAVIFSEGIEKMVR